MKYHVPVPSAEKTSGPGRFPDDGGNSFPAVNAVEVANHRSGKSRTATGLIVTGVNHPKRPVPPRGVFCQRYQRFYTFNPLSKPLYY
jgi:hypothetical protein